MSQNKIVKFREFNGRVGYFIKTFFVDATYNRNGWWVTKDSIVPGLESGMEKKFFGKTAPIILREDWEQAPKRGHPSPFTKTMIADQEPSRVGDFVAVGTDADGNHGWAMLEITKEAAREEIDAGRVMFVSPSIVSFKTINGRDTKWGVNHLALVDDPAYGTRANITGRCFGTDGHCMPYLVKNAAVDSSFVLRSRGDMMLCDISVKQALKSRSGVMLQSIRQALVGRTLLKSAAASIPKSLRNDSGFDMVGKKYGIWRTMDNGKKMFLRIVDGEVESPETALARNTSWYGKAEPKADDSGTITMSGHKFKVPPKVDFGEIDFRERFTVLKKNMADMMGQWREFGAVSKVSGNATSEQRARFKAGLKAVGAKKGTMHELEYGGLLLDDASVYSLDNVIHYETLKAGYAYGGLEMDNREPFGAVGVIRFISRRGGTLQLEIESDPTSVQFEAIKSYIAKHGMTQDDVVIDAKVMKKKKNLSNAEQYYMNFFGVRDAAVRQAGKFKPKRGEEPDENGYYWRTIAGKRTPFKEGEETDTKVKAQFDSRKNAKKPKKSGFGTSMAKRRAMDKEFDRARDLFSGSVESLPSNPKYAAMQKEYGSLVKQSRSDNLQDMMRDKRHNMDKENYDKYRKLYNDILKINPKIKEQLDHANKLNVEQLEKSKTVYRGCTKKTLDAMLDNNGEVGHIARVKYTEGELDFVPGSLSAGIAKTFARDSGIQIMFDISNLNSNEYKAVTYYGHPRVRSKDDFVYGQGYGGEDSTDFDDYHEVHLKRGATPIIREVGMRDKDDYETIDKITRLAKMQGAPILIRGPYDENYNALPMFRPFSVSGE